MVNKQAFCAFIALVLIFSPTSAKAVFGGHIGSHLGIGNLGGAGQPVGNTSVGTLDLQAMPGYRILGNSLMLGPLFNLRYLSQLAGSNAVGKDVTGTGLLVGVAIDYDFSVFKIIASWDIRARHNHDKPDTTYKGSGYTLLFGYKTLPDFYVDFMLNKTSYNARDVNGVPETLVKPLQHWNLAIGMS
ncbi:MAG: hypothetical protein ACXWQO_13640, partial [Bdellovibrionota bacterium]